MKYKHRLCSICLGVYPGSRCCCTIHTATSWRRTTTRSGRGWEWGWGRSVRYTKGRKTHTLNLTLNTAS